jgi:hypothetical protein
MLRSFQDLVRVLTIHPAKYDAIYYPRKTVAGDYDKLFDIIRKGNHHAEEEVVDDLYGSHDQKSTTRYFTLKSRLKDRIENGFFFLSTERFSHRSTRRYAAWKEQLITWALWQAGARETAVQRLEKLAEEAETLGFTDVCIFAYRHIRLFYAQQGSMVLLKKFDALLNTALDRASAEMKAETLIAEIEVFKARETLLGTEHEERCRLAVTAIEQFVSALPNAAPTYTLSALAGKAAQYLAEASQSYEKTLITLEKTERQLSAYPNGVEQEERGQFAGEALHYALAAKDFIASKQALESFCDVTASEMPEVLTAQEYYFLTAMHSQNYDALVGILESVLQTPAFMRFAGEKASIWQTYELYARIVLDDEIPQRPTLFKPRFSVNKILAEMPEYQENTAAKNCAWLIGQILFLLKDGDFEGIAKYNAELIRYHEKYLRRETLSYRLQCFLRMVNHAVFCNFELTETLRKTQKYYTWLSSARTFDIVKGGTMEVLPFEHLWAFMLFRMKNKSERKTTPLRQILATAAEAREYYV